MKLNISVIVEAANCIDLSQHTPEQFLCAYLVPYAWRECNLRNGSDGDFVTSFEFSVPSFICAHLTSWNFKCPASLERRRGDGYLFDSVAFSAGADFSSCS